MLVVYLIGLIVGGGLVVLSIAGGADGHGAGHGGDLGGHGPDLGAHGAGGHGDAAGHSPAADVLRSWLPLASLRFWTFFAAFFGLSGTAMTMLGVAGPVPIAIAASVVGYASGLALVRALRHLQGHAADSSLAEGDLVGASGQVMVPLAAGRAGKIRLHIKDRAVDLLAETEEPGEIAIGDRVVVIGMTAGGLAVVARAAALTA